MSEDIGEDGQHEQLAAVRRLQAQAADQLRSAIWEEAARLAESLKIDAPRLAGFLDGECGLAYPFDGEARRRPGE